MKNFTLITTITTAMLIAGAASAQQVGVVGIYQNGAALDMAILDDLGCTIQRSGAIVAMQGNLTATLTQPDQFVVLTCEEPVVGNAERRAAIEMLSSGGEAIGIFEGALTDFEELADTQVATTRQYVVKLGYYNNADIDGRDAGLQALDAKASERDGVWSTESFLHVHSASGLATPDEVVILYYDTPDAAKNFRDNNQDILEDISAFNRAHLNGFQYFVGFVTE